MNISIIFLISLLTNFAVGKNVKCSKTEIGKVGYECITNLEAPVDDSITKNGEIIEANVSIREKRSPAKRKKKGKTKKKEIGDKKRKRTEKSGKIKKSKEKKCNQFVKIKNVLKKGEKKNVGKIKEKKNPEKGKKKKKKPKEKGEKKKKKPKEKGKKKKKKPEKSRKRTKRAADPKSEIVPMGHPKWVQNAVTIKYGPFDVKEFGGNRG